MKKILISACVLLAMTLSANAQNRDLDDDGAAFTERIAQDGSPMPANPMAKNMGMDWSRRITLAVAPIQFTEVGIGGGLSVERALDRNGYISVYVPVMCTFRPNGNNEDRYYSSYGYYGYNEIRNRVMLSAMPGIKIYPTGMGKVKYAVGASLVGSYGMEERSFYNYPYYDPYYNNNLTVMPEPYYNNVKETRFILGMMVNNSINMNLVDRLYIGAELGFGFSYLNRVYSSYGNYNDGTRFLTQGGFKIGYVF